MAISGEQLGIPTGGSGFVYDAERGLIVTGAHAVEATEDIRAKLGEAAGLVGVRTLGVAPCDELAVLQLPISARDGLVELTLAEPTELRRGAGVTALGYPAQFRKPSEQTVHAGAGRVLDPALRGAQIGPDLPSLRSLVEHDAPLDRGAGGGPLVDAEGRAVGVNVVSEAPQGDRSYAIGSDRVEELLGALRNGDRLRPGWDLLPLDSVDLAAELELLLGEKLHEAGLTPGEAARRARRRGLPAGMYVLATEPGLPAERADIFAGDLIVAIDGREVRSMDDVCDALRAAGPGSTVTVDGVAIASSTRLGDIGREFTVVVDVPGKR